MNDENMVVIFCPPVSQYAVPPKDMSECTQIDCPNCKNKMWLSEKKKEILEKTNYKILLLCYDCMKDYAKNNPEVFKGHLKIDI